eukprot:TRINITY_DN5349_c0_g1_i1.p1 TRINITY_DN5349_c0_g1~~TRINITY_DN5349_c0_g1_i1.p1  ORF type:complete len:694 (+),score=106.96 TRINITY_DN5349_c0_g1_i1:60-2084(+)
MCIRDRYMGYQRRVHGDIRFFESFLKMLGEESLCETHGQRFMSFCSVDSCEKPLLCAECAEDHCAGHSEQIILIEDLLGDNEHPNPLMEALDTLAAEGESLSQAFQRTFAEQIRKVEFLFNDLSTIVLKKLEAKKSELLLGLTGQPIESNLSEVNHLRVLVRNMMSCKVDTTTIREIWKMNTIMKDVLLPKVVEKMKNRESQLMTTQQVLVDLELKEDFETRAEALIQSISMEHDANEQIHRVTLAKRTPQQKTLEVDKSQMFSLSFGKNNARFKEVIQEDRDASRRKIQFEGNGEITFKEQQNLINDQVAPFFAINEFITQAKSRREDLLSVVSPPKFAPKCSGVRRPKEVLEIPFVESQKENLNYAGDFGKPVCFTKLWTSEQEYPMNVLLSLQREEMFFCGAENGLIHVFQTRTGQSFCELRAHSAKVTSIVKMGEAGSLASSDSSGLIVIWQKFQSPVHRILAHEGSVTALAYLNEEKMLLTGGDDRALKAWNPVTGTGITAFYNIHQGPVTSIVGLRDRRQFATTSLDCKIRLWQMRSGCVRTFDLQQEIPQSLLYLDGISTLFVGCSSGKLQIIPLGRGQVKIIQLHKSAIYKLCPMEQGRRILSVECNGMAKLWIIDPNTLDFESSLWEAPLFEGFLPTGCATDDDGKVYLSNSQGSINLQQIRPLV